MTIIARRNFTEQEVQIIRDRYYSDGALALAKELGRSAKVISHKASSMGIKGRLTNMRKMIINETFFSFPSCINSYWAGFIAADGNLSETGILRVDLHISDRNHLEKMLEALECKNLTIANATNRPSCSINIGCKQICDDLRSFYRLTPRKTLTLQPPSLSWQASLCWIAGYIDGDGCIYVSHNQGKLKNRSNCVLTIAGTESVLIWIKSIVDAIAPASKFHFHSAKVLKHKKANCFTYTIGGIRPLFLYQEIMEQSASLPLMSRKWDKLRNFYQNVAISQVKTKNQQIYQ